MTLYTHNYTQNSDNAKVRACSLLPIENCTSPLLSTTKTQNTLDSERAESQICIAAQTLHRCHNILLARDDKRRGSIPLLKRKSFKNTVRSLLISLYAKHNKMQKSPSLHMRLHMQESAGCIRLKHGGLPTAYGGLQNRRARRGGKSRD